jgi:DNA-binding beta-propeller fold protein YncE
MALNSTKSYRILLIFTLLALAAPIHATVEWEIQTAVQTTAEPLDVAVHPDGQQIFVLTVDGKVRIYDPQGRLTDTIAVGTHVDQIEIGPEGERLFAASRRNKTVEVIALAFIHSIDTSEAPFKGLEDAPVVMTVFSDFE